MCFFLMLCVDLLPSEISASCWYGVFVFVFNIRVRSPPNNCQCPFLGHLPSAKVVLHFNLFSTTPKLNVLWLSRPALLNLLPIGRVWPKGLFCSAKCTLTTQKIERHYCLILKFKKETHLAKRTLDCSILTL